MRVCCVMALCIVAPGIAAQEAETDSLVQQEGYSLDEVVVSTPFMVRKTTATSPFQALSRSQFEQQGVTDMADALRRFSGLPERTD